MGLSAGGVSGRLDPKTTIADVLVSQGTFNWSEIAQRSGQSIEEAQNYARSAGVAFQDPETGQWELAGGYLSGNVRRKLFQARKLAEIDPSYQANVKALEQVLPESLGPGDIKVALGTGWIPEKDITQFASSELGLDVKVEYVSRNAKWYVTPTEKFKKNRYRSKSNTKVWGTSQADGITLLEQALNGKDATIKNPRNKKQDLDATFAARDKQRLMQEAFRRWIWRDGSRTKRLVSAYNESFNSVIPPTFNADLVPDRFPGQVETIDGQPFALRRHQKSAVLRALFSKKNGFLIHGTGAGKTLVMGTVAMELKRRQRLQNEAAGRVNHNSQPASGGKLPENVIQIVPNHRPFAHASEIKRVYPNANILIVESDDLKKETYDATMKRIANGDYDFAVLTHAAFERIPPGKAIETFILQRSIAECDEALSNLPRNATKKRKALDRQRGVYVKKLDKVLADAETEEEKLTWKDLNITHAAIDESHRYKNMGFSTKHAGIAGINPHGSTRALDFQTKMTYLQRRCPNCQRFVTSSGACQNCGQSFKPQVGNILLSTATPIDNSIAELFNWQRVLQPEELERLELESFDAWVAQFSGVSKNIELDIYGSGFKEGTRFKDFRNVPELSAIFSQVADVELDMEKLGLKLPKIEGGRPQIVKVKLTDRQQAFMAEAMERGDRIRSRSVDFSEDNWLKLIGDIQRAMIDIRLVDPTARDDQNSKINTMLPEVIETYKNTTGVSLPDVPGKHNLTQVIWCDVGVPGGSTFNLYNDMKRKLIDGGVKPEEIAFIQSYKSAEEKAMLFDQINQGKTRILIASTALAGEGANFQRLLKAAYSIEPGLNWKSSPSRQRRGRAERQGNLNQTIRLKQYVAPGGDAYIWQAIERKALTSDQILKYGENRERVVEDIGDFHPDYSLVKAAAAGNALAREQVAAQLEITRLRSLQNSHLKEQAEARQTIDEARAEIDFLEQIVGPDSIPAVEADSRIRITELHQQISDAQETLTRIFPYEAELIEATQRLTSLEAQIAKENAGPLASIKQKASPAGLFKRLMGRK